MFFPKAFYDKGTSPIFCNTAATMLTTGMDFLTTRLLLLVVPGGGVFSRLFFV